MNELEPAFDFIKDQSSILLHQGCAAICIDGNKYSGSGEVRLDLLPKADIHLYGYFEGVSVQDAMGAHMGQKTISSFSIDGRQIEGFRLSSGGDIDSKEYNVKWCPKSEPILGVGDESTQMSRLVFHLFNFVDLIGTRRTMEQSGTAMHAIEHIDLVSDEWKIELKSLISTRENIKILKEAGGYQLTHIGDIQKTDGASFSGKDAYACLKAVRFFLSFAKGGWCEPLCAVGFDGVGNRVWECWSSPRDPWHEPISWFDHHNSSQLAALFPCFIKKWANDDWAEALQEVIWWYSSANFSSRGIDAGIILTQAAIERLSYEYAVKEKRLLTVNGFKDLWASDKFRLLFSSIGLSLDIPNETPKSRQFAGQMNWLDAPHSLTEIRNSLVHPEHKHRRQFGNVYHEAWNLGLWYLEMSVLAVCDYCGTYGSRLKRRFIGQIEDVPWKK